MEETKLEVPRDDIKRAVGVLLKLLKSKSDILRDQEKINLMFSMKKIPKMRDKIIKLPLSHGLATPELDVCLFVKDLDPKSRDYETTEDHFNDMLRDKGVQCILKVIPIKALKIEHKPYEAKRNLSNMYDVFLADKRIFGSLPPLLGKAFYGRKRVPIQVNMSAADLKSEISKAINDSRCIISGRGSSYQATVAHSKHTADQIAVNVEDAIHHISAAIPGGAANIRNFYIKTETSMAIPVYVSLNGVEDVSLPDSHQERQTEIIEEIDTIVGGKVRVKKTGEVDFVREDGTIPSDLKKKAHLAKLKRKGRKNKVKRLRTKAKSLEADKEVQRNMPATFKVKKGSIQKDIKMFLPKEEVIAKKKRKVASVQNKQRKGKTVKNSK